jgi:hypothetical protein
MDVFTRPSRPNLSAEAFTFMDAAVAGMDLSAEALAKADA